MNLLLSETGVLKIADFGLARGMSLPDRTYTEEVATLYYRAPEVILMQRYSTEMDIWSVGCVFYEMVTKKCLFQGDSPVDQIHRILRALGTPTIEDWPDIIRSKNPDISSANLPKYPKQRLSAVFPDLPLEPAGYDLLEVVGGLTLAHAGDEPQEPNLRCDGADTCRTVSQQPYFYEVANAGGIQRATDLRGSNPTQAPVLATQSASEKLPQ